MTIKTKGEMRTGEELRFLYMHIRATGIEIDLAMKRQWFKSAILVVMFALSIYQKK